MYAATDFTCYVQIPDGGIPNIAENSARLAVIARNVNIQRMTITLEGSKPVSVFAYAYTKACGDVGLKAGINPILAFISLCHLMECAPVVGVADGDKLRPHSSCVMAVGHRHRAAGILSCPCFVVVCFGADAVGREETVSNGCTTLFINPTDETAITVAIITLETTVELTVGDGNFGIGYASYDTSERAFAIHGTFQGNRRPAVLNGCRAINDLSHEAGWIHLAGCDGTGRVQILDGGIAHIDEGS